MSNTKPLEGMTAEQTVASLRDYLRRYPGDAKTTDASALISSVPAIPLYELLHLRNEVERLTALLEAQEDAERAAYAIQCERDHLNAQNADLVRYLRSAREYIRDDSTGGLCARQAVDLFLEQIEQEAPHP